MSKNMKGAIPKWRFESFDSYLKWDIKKLGCLMEPINERAGDKKYVLMSVTSGVGLIPQVEKFGREIAGNSYKNYYVIRKNDFAYNKSSTKEFPEGYISMLKEYEEAAIPNSIFTCFRVIDDEYEPLFFEQLFNTNYHGKWLRKYIEIGARAHGALSIDTKHLWNMPVAVPKLPEQQKIADCLSSIDDLISAEKKKLSLLNDYKKGWMQNLFPTEKKTVPEFRFPEFRNSGDWEEKELSSSLDYLQPTPYLVQSENYDEKYKIPVLTAGKSFILGHTNEKEGIFNKKLPVIIFDDFTTTSKFVDFPFKVKSSAMKILLAKNSTNIKFVFEVMQMINYDVSVHRRHWISIFSKLKVPIPPKPEEQQKITNFLSGIDDLITRQTDKIEALKQHKTALMQGLFPSIEEVLK